MKSPTEIHWEAAKAWAEAHGQDAVVIVSMSMNPHLTHVLTWGRTLQLSDYAARGGNDVKDQLWPEDKPHNDMPAWLTGLIEVYKAATHATEEGGIGRLRDTLITHGPEIKSKIANRQS